LSPYAFSNYHADLQKLVRVFLRAAQILPAADLLPARTGRGTLRSDLLRLELSLLSDDFDLDHIKPLLKAALDVNPDDAFIWDQVYNAVTASTPPPQPITAALQRTPPQSVLTSLDGTPVVRSTSSFQGKEQTKKILDHALLYELRGRIFRGVDGFFGKYFEGQSWTKRCKSIY
jgi:hypothetical protein